MKFETTIGKKKYIVTLTSSSGNTSIGFNGVFSVNGKSKGELLTTFVHYIPPTENMEDEFFNKVSKLPQFKNSIRI